MGCKAPTPSDGVHTNLGFNRNIMGCKAFWETILVTNGIGFNRNIMGCKDGLLNNFSMTAADLIGT